ncbi:MAG: hypothetical protein M3O70_05215, partial [Actinomycetota bacterium]|nr:hypothetical protein [Actinomycetota bacterium]
MFVVGAQVEVDGEIWLHVETTAEVIGCSSCGTRAVGHGQRRALPLHDHHNQPVRWSGARSQ